jgi:uncharacterized glyoxalase superfamily protein PhnB
MTPECSATIFHVNDVDISIEYYVNVLGFKLEFRYRDLAGIEHGPVTIYLSGPKQDQKKKTGEGSIYIFCDEVDEYYKDILRKGAVLDVPIEDRPYNMRDFAIKDLDGNAITFGKSVGKLEEMSGW